MLLEDNYLAHYGIKGQRWGVRRFQNNDGTYTPAGRERYGNALTEENYRAKINEYEKRAQNATKPFTESYGKKYKDGTTTYRNDMDSLDGNKKFDSLLKYVWDKLGADHDKTYKLGKEAIESKKGVRKHPITDKAVKRSNASKEADLQFSKQFAEEMEKLNKYALDYINKNFSGRERDIAKAYVYYNYLEGN